jgi:VanZ family protein
MTPLESVRLRTAARVLLAIWLAIVIWGSVITGRELSHIEKFLPFLGLKTLRHLGAYAGLAFLSVLSFERRTGIAVALSMIVLGIAIELCQNLSPGRTPETGDVLVNTVGVITGMVLGSALARRSAPIRLL